MYTNKQELLQSQTNVGTVGSIPSSTDKLIERELIEGTPFWLIKKDEEYTLVMGRYKVNHVQLNNKEEVVQFLKDEMYNIISTMIFIINNEQKNQSPI